MSWKTKYNDSSFEVKSLYNNRFFLMIFCLISVIDKSVKMKKTWNICYRAPFYAFADKIWADSGFKYSCFGPFKNVLFLVVAAIFDGVHTYQIQFRMGTTQGLFLPSLMHIGPVVLEKKIEIWKTNRHTLDYGHWHDDMFVYPLPKGVYVCMYNMP